MARLAHRKSELHINTLAAIDQPKAKPRFASCFNPDHVSVNFSSAHCWYPLSPGMSFFYRIPQCVIRTSIRASGASADLNLTHPSTYRIRHHRGVKCEQATSTLFRLLNARKCTLRGKSSVGGQRL